MIVLYPMLMIGAILCNMANFDSLKKHISHNLRARCCRCFHITLSRRSLASSTIYFLLVWRSLIPWASVWGFCQFSSVVLTHFLVSTNACNLSEDTNSHLPLCSFNFAPPVPVLLPNRKLCFNSFVPECMCRYRT